MKHVNEHLLAYLSGALSSDEHQKQAQHLQNCSDCQETLNFARDLDARLKSDPMAPVADEPCPEVSLISRLSEGELDQITAQHVRAHVLHCRACLEEFMLC